LIHGIGTDIISIPRCEEMLARQGRRIAERILTARELVGFDAAAKPAAFLAKRFAAKEACAKALGTGFRDGLSLLHIEVENDALGAPHLRLSGRAEVLWAEYGLTACHLSLSDEKNYAVAFVTLERATPQG